MKARIAKTFKINDLGRARFTLGIQNDYDIECRALRISQKAYAESNIMKFGQANAKPCLQPLEARVQFMKVDQPQTEVNKAKMSSKPYRSLEGSLMYLESGTRSDISIAVAQPRMLASRTTDAKEPSSSLTRMRTGSATVTP
ncbi:hypothetical protein PC113_g20480 [Phytophthora cactorum]|uniref:Reverse transcriptase Ty1/copia-type domain-containing protein n=1 Tax=Phytophthora cactorum TaxID=29920 RepID=A0A8T0Y8G3_9STRA|nr:hypothetical protein PC113_g20480 [Phytophthora cactorum]